MAAANTGSQLTTGQGPKKATKPHEETSPGKADWSEVEVAGERAKEKVRNYP